MAIKTCKNGHNYDDILFSECPICPKVNESDKTKIIHKEPKEVATEFSDRKQDATKVVDGSETVSDRKLVGFLVTYDIHPLGTAFRLYEGRNNVGSSRGCDIVIENDSLVSGKHLTILYRNKIFLFKDEFSTNGTFVNGNMENEGELYANDLIKIGNKRLIFLQVPFEKMGL